MCCRTTPERESTPVIPRIATDIQKIYQDHTIAWEALHSTESLVWVPPQAGWYIVNFDAAQDPREP